MALLEWFRRRLGGASREEPGRPREMISCQEALSAVYDYLDGELEDAPADRVREHFEACARCYPHLRLEESFRAAIRGASGADRVPVGLRERVLDLISRDREE